MDELLRLLYASLPEAIGGLLTAAVLVLVGAISARMLWLRRKGRQHMTEPSQLSDYSPDQIRDLLTLKRRRLQELKKKQALKGINTEPEILIEIEDLEKEIRRLEGAG